MNQMNQRNENTSLLSKVPEVTIYFWIIKILCTTVGETISDFLNVNLGLGLTGTSVVMGALLLITLFFQFKAKKYIPALYWLTVVLISIFGTLVTDNLTDKLGIPLELSTIVFSIALALTFAAWFSVERTLSIHSIFTWRRESFYWLAVLFTFALGTATGDLMAESLGLGYFVTGVIVAVVIGSAAIAWRLGLDSMLAFWIAYIMTRPMGASIGDFLSQSPANGGLGLGATVTSVIFLLAILLTVIFLSITKQDLIASPSTNARTNRKRYSVVWQVTLAMSVLMITAASGYHWRHTTLQQEATVSVSSASPLGDLSSFRKITEDTLSLVRANNLSAATSRVTDLETAWDNAVGKLKSMNSTQWSVVDKSIDTVLRQLRATQQDPAGCKTALESLISTLDALDHRK
jgi:uncharacterized membrane-anchored protein